MAWNNNSAAFLFVVVLKLKCLKVAENQQGVKEQRWEEGELQTGLLDSHGCRDWESMGEEMCRMQGSVTEEGRTTRLEPPYDSRWVWGGNEEEREMGVEKLTERRRELWGKLRIQAKAAMKSGRDWQRDWYGSVEKSEIQSDKKRRRNAVYATTADASQAMIVLSSNRGSAVGIRTRTFFLRAADMKTVHFRGQTPTLYVCRCHALSFFLCLLS